MIFDNITDEEFFQFLDDVLVSHAEEDQDGTDAANVVDGLFFIGRELGRIADALNGVAEATREQLRDAQRNRSV